MSDLLIIPLLLAGCSTHEIKPRGVDYPEDIAQFHKYLFPFGNTAYTRLDDIEGRWVQVDDWAVFPQKTPWSQPAEILVSRDNVVFTIKPWGRNSETIQNNEMELLGLFFDFEYPHYPKNMFRRDGNGYIVLTVRRGDLYMQGANKNGSDFLGIGLFDPPMVLQREKEPNQSLEPTTMAVTPPAAQESRQP
jgi:hypothetical protein